MIFNSFNYIVFVVALSALLQWVNYLTDNNFAFMLGVLSGSLSVLMAPYYFCQTN